jgi:putative beta-lysine N-acetyltransferase
MLEQTIKIVTKNDCYMKVSVDRYNERVLVIDYRGNPTTIINEAHAIARSSTATKLIIFSREEDWKQFLAFGYVVEAVIDKYFNGATSFILALYLNMERKQSTDWLKEDELLQKIVEKEHTKPVAQTPSAYTIRRANENDAENLASLYKQVFQLYPTPMHDSTYIKKVMDDDSIFYVCEHESKIVSSASADINSEFYHAELTDCATLPEHRKHRLMKHLLLKLENDLRQRSIFCAFSIARARSFGMNAAFFDLGYQYRGRLCNNCYIYDKLEDMNVWVKDLSQNI